MSVHYKEHPLEPNDGNRDLQLLFRIDEDGRWQDSDDAAEETTSPEKTVQERLTTIKTSFRLPRLTEKTTEAPKWNPAISKYVTVKWDEWTYLKRGSETVISEVPQASSRKFEMSYSIFRFLQCFLFCRFWS